MFLGNTLKRELTLYRVYTGVYDFTIWCAAVRGATLSKELVSDV